MYVERGDLVDELRRKHINGELVDYVPKQLYRFENTEPPGRTGYHESLVRQYFATVRSLCGHLATAADYGHPDLTELYWGERLPDSGCRLPVGFRSLRRR